MLISPTDQIRGVLGAVESRIEPQTTPSPRRGHHARYSRLFERQECASGKAHYVCANGFTGCCSIDPCDPGEGCSDSSVSSVHLSTETVHSSTTERTASTTGTTTNAAIKPVTRTVHSSGSASTASAPVAPDCPAGNGSIFTDSRSIPYTIHCAADNNATSTQTITIEAGGYSQCFSTCSSSSTCAGFTYVGLEGGDCYLKASLPQDQYVAKAEDNYITCAKVNSTGLMSSPGPSATPSSRPGRKTSSGAIAGGVVFLIILLVLIAFFARRHRRYLEQKRATKITHVVQGPVEIPPMAGTDPSTGLPRLGSTSNDVFAPFGGSVHHARQRSIYRDREEQTWV